MEDSNDDGSTLLSINPTSNNNFISANEIKQKALTKQQKQQLIPIISTATAVILSVFIFIIAYSLSRQDIFISSSSSSFTSASIAAGTLASASSSQHNSNDEGKNGVLFNNGNGDIVDEKQTIVKQRMLPSSCTLGLNAQCGGSNSDSSACCAGSLTCVSISNLISLCLNLSGNSNSTNQPTSLPTNKSTKSPVKSPTSRSPTLKPASESPTPKPTSESPTPKPTSESPTTRPSGNPTQKPTDGSEGGTLTSENATTKSPTFPTRNPSNPTRSPAEPTRPPAVPSRSPIEPTNSPVPSTKSPTIPTKIPTDAPTFPPTDFPTPRPQFTKKPTNNPAPPARVPTGNPSTKIPTPSPTFYPTSAPSLPTESPTKKPSASPTPWVCPNQAFDQCGGRFWRGESCCGVGTTCNKIHAGLSLCWPNKKLLPCTYAPTMVPTTKEQFSSYIEKQAEALSIENNTITPSSLILIIVSFVLVFISFLLVVRQRRKKMMQKKRKGSKGSVFRPDVQMKKKVNYMEGTPMPKASDNNKALPTPSIIPPVDLEKAKKFEKEFGISKNIAKRTRWSIGKHLEFMQKHSAIRAGAEYIIPANEIKIITTFRSIGKESTHKGLFAGAPVAIKEITLNDDVAAASSISLNDPLKYRQQKQLTPSIGRSDEDLFNSFLIDFQMMKYLQHPNIVQLFGVSSLDNKNRRLLLITELCEYSLRQVMASDSLRKLLNVPSILYIARSVAVACNFIHSKGVVHFNLKPENILLNHDVTVVKVSDLGLSQINYKREAFLSGTDSRGLPVYVAPELINDPQQKASRNKMRVGSEEKSVNQSQAESRTPRESNLTITPRIGADGMNLNDATDVDTDDESEGVTSSSEVDVYSFGFILWEMFHAPYPCCPLEWDAYKVVIQTKFNNWRPRIDPQLPEVISTIITRCWDADPHKRPTMKQVITMIDLADAQLGYDSDEDDDEEEEEEEKDGERTDEREDNHNNNDVIRVNIDGHDHPNDGVIATSAASGMRDTNALRMVPSITTLAPGESAASSTTTRPPLPPRKTSGVIITSMLAMKKKKQKGMALQISRANRTSFSEEL